jgi:hypothetical protein
VSPVPEPAPPPPHTDQWPSNRDRGVKRRISNTGARKCWSAAEPEISQAVTPTTATISDCEDHSPSAAQTQVFELPLARGRGRTPGTDRQAPKVRSLIGQQESV